MKLRAVITWALLTAILGLAAFGYWQGTPQDIINAVHVGDVLAVNSALASDPALARTKVYPQAYERVSQQKEFEAKFGRSPWQGRYLVHDALALAEPLPMLQALLAAGADLWVRLDGATLLHLAVRAGQVGAANWLHAQGLSVQARNDCQAACPEHGQTPLHDAQALRDEEMSEWLLDRGAQVDALREDGKSALHVAGKAGRLGGALVLCRHGADAGRKDADGHTSHDLAKGLSTVAGADVRGQAPSQLVQWLKPGGGCSQVAAMARTAGRPVPEADARKVYSRTVEVDR